MTFERSEKFYREMILMYRKWVNNIIIIKEMDNNDTPAVVENIVV